MSKNKSTVWSKVYSDLRLKMDQGFTLDQIKAMSQNDIEAYCLYFRHTYGHEVRQYKDGTVNRYVETFIKANKAV